MDIAPDEAPGTQMPEAPKTDQTAASVISGDPRSSLLVAHAAEEFADPAPAYWGDPVGASAPSTSGAPASAPSPSVREERPEPVIRVIKIDAITTVVLFPPY